MSEATRVTSNNDTRITTNGDTRVVLRPAFYDDPEHRPNTGQTDAENQRLAPDALVYLFAMDTRPIGGNDIFCWTAGVLAGAPLGQLMPNPCCAGNTDYYFGSGYGLGCGFDGLNCFNGISPLALPYSPFAPQTPQTLIRRAQKNLLNQPPGDISQEVFGLCGWNRCHIN